ncbi:hypothetical protein DDE82_004512 [Stemphylium lycopersici]|nr:hypothetical protein DDE82_004512 [Stemphylium lycopersici]
MHILKIPYSLVATDAAAAKAIQDSSHPSSRTQRFSTAHHKRGEILPIVPENVPHFTHTPPPWTPYGYALWHDLIAASQGLKQAEYHEILIPSFLYEDMMRCHSAWVSTGRIHGAILSEVLDTLHATKAGKRLAALLDGERKWFIRLDQMSPKDSPMGGKLPSSTLEDVVMKLCSSMRAYGCLVREKEDAEKQGREMVIRLALNRWDEGMDPAREFRVFVPPPAAAAVSRSTNALIVENFKISAISQCFSLEETVAKVEAGADTVLADIVAYAQKELSEDIVNMLLKHGLSFDVALQQDGSVQLVEINPFGALSGCGACLFNWVLDGKVLYGLGEAQFAVTLDGAV